MKFRSILIPIGVCSCFLAGWLFAAPQQSQTSPKSITKGVPKGAAQKAPAKRPPLTKADVQKLWAQKEQDLLLNEIRLRGLEFEPDDAWVESLPNPSDQPLAIAELRKRVPPAPEVDAVATQAPDLLAKIRDAAQKRNEQALLPLIHPDLVNDKARLYDLFDPGNYRSHSLGKVSAMDHRRVGVQFFQLTTSQVERLHYIVFASYRGNLVVRDVITGEPVAKLFLHDEEELGKSKLELVFRALNDGDANALTTLCTPGFLESLKKRAGDEGGSILTRGQHISLDKVLKVPTVSLDQKSVRVVVRVTYPAASGPPLQYDIDFERIGNDLKVVRARDVMGGVIAWDPDIDNYLNRRYGLPDGPPVQNVAESDDPNFDNLSSLRERALRAITNRDAKKLKDCAEQFLQREPSSGEGYGMRASAQHMLGKQDEATADAQKAIEKGGTVYFDVVQYSNSITHNFSPIILAVSKGKIELRPAMGGPGEVLSPTSVATSFEKPARGGLSAFKQLLDQPGPFLKLDVARQKNKSFRLAAVGTTCPDASTARNKNLEQYGGGGCGSEGATIQAAKPVSILVPHDWFQDLKTIQDAVEYAKQGAAQSKR